MFIISPLIRTILRILSYILYFVTLLSAFGGMVNPEYFPLPSLLVLPLQYLAIATAIVTVAWFCSGKLITGGLGLVTLIVGWSSISMAVPLSFKNKPEPDTQTIKLVTFNCLHMDDIRKERDLNRSLKFLLESDADIICLQELLLQFDKRESPWLDPVLIDSLMKKYPYHPSMGYSDLKIFSKYPAHTEPTLNPANNPYWPPAYRFYRVSVNGTILMIANVHLPSYHLSEEERNVMTEIRGFRSAKKSADEMKNSIVGKLKSAFKRRAESVDSLMAALKLVKHPIIVCGDFNDVPASWCYRQFVKSGFEDAYTATSFGPTFTFNKHLFYFHIDQRFYRGDIEPLSVKRATMNASDHYPLVATFALPVTKDGNKPFDPRAGRSSR